MTTTPNSVSRQPSLRFRIAQIACRQLPPILGMRLRAWLYPDHLGEQDGFTFMVRSQTGGWFKGTTSEMHACAFGICGYSTYRNWAIAIALCKPGDTIIEVGANIGTETVGFADIVGCRGHVYAFEPFPANLESLRETLKLAPCANVTVMPFALGEDDGEFAFVPPTGANTGVGRLLQRDRPAPPESLSVQCRTLDSLASELPAPTFICMDAEDSETYVLRGGAAYIQQHRPGIVVEAHRKVQPMLHEELQQLGYHAFVVGRFGLNPVGELAKRGADWFCVHQSRIEDVQRVDRVLRRCVLMPCVSGMNPMTGIAQKPGRK